MPTITLGPLSGPYAQVAHQLELERQARVEQQLAQDRINAQIEEARQTRGVRVQDFEFRQQQADQSQANFEAQQARLMFQDMTAKQLRILEEQRIKEGKDREFGAGNYKTAVDEGWMIDANGQPRQITQEQDPALWQARQERLAQKTAGETRMKAQDAEKQAQWRAERDMQYAKAGYAIDEQPANPADPLSPKVYMPRAITEQDPGWQLYQGELAKEAEKKATKDKEAAQKVTEANRRDFEAVTQDLHAEEDAKTTIQGKIAGIMRQKPESPITVPNPDAFEDDEAGKQKFADAMRNYLNDKQAWDDKLAGEAAPFKVQLQKKDGRIRDLEARAAALQGPAGLPVPPAGPKIATPQVFREYLKKSSASSLDRPTGADIAKASQLAAADGWTLPFAAAGQ
jgi:hypothetical protein